MFINDDPNAYGHYYSYCDGYPVLYSHSIPSDSMENSSELSFAQFLWYFIHWQSGRPIAPEEEATSDQWSKLIWDIIVNTHNAKICNSNTDIQKKHNIGRNHGDFFQFLTTNDCMNIIPPTYNDYRKVIDDGGNYLFEDSIDEEYNGATSILFIDIQHIR